MSMTIQTGRKMVLVLLVLVVGSLLLAGIASSVSHMKP